MTADKENQKLKIPNIGAPAVGRALMKRRRMWVISISIVCVVGVTILLLAMKAGKSGFI